MLNYQENVTAIDNGNEEIITWELWHQENALHAFTGENIKAQ